MTKVTIITTAGKALTDLEVESIIPPGGQFKYWTLFFPVDELDHQVVQFYNSDAVAVVEMKGVPQETPKEEEVQDYGVPPDQVSGMFGKHRD